MLPFQHSDLQRVVANLLGSGHTVQKILLDPLMIYIIRLRNASFYNKPFHLFKYSMHIPHFILNNERQGERDRGGEGGSGRVRERSWRKEEQRKSERTKCNLSAYSDSQCLKWELTENVEDCSLIGQSHSWHFQAKLQWWWWERMCYNCKLFSLPPVLLSRFTKHFYSFIIFALSFMIMLTKPHSWMGRYTHTCMNHAHCFLTLAFDLRWHHIT